MDLAFFQVIYTRNFSIYMNKVLEMDVKLLILRVKDNKYFLYN